MRKIVLFLFSLALSFNLFGDERFDIQNSVIKDYMTDLMWQKNGSSNSMNWSSAKEYCENATTGNYYNWRLPHVDALKSIVNYSKSNPATFNGFNLKSKWYWTNTTVKPDSSKSWVVGFNSGSDGWNTHDSSYFSVCARLLNFNVS